MEKRAVSAAVRRAHRTLAQALEVEGDQDSVVDRARHWWAAGDDVAFATCAIQAAQHAADRGDPESAADLLWLLLDAWDVEGVAAAVQQDVADVVVEAGRMRRRAGDLDAAASQARTLAESHVRGPAARIAALVELAATLAEQADPGAEEAARSALRAAMDLPDTPASTRLLCWAAGTARDLGVTEAAGQGASEAARRAVAWGLDDVSARADNTTGLVLCATDPEAAMLAFGRSRAASERHVDSDPTLLLRWYINAAGAHLSHGRFAESAAVAGEGLAYAFDHGFGLTSGPHIAGALAEALIAAGRLTEAERHLATWRPRARGSRDGWWLDALSGRVQLLRGDVSAAQDVVAALEGATQRESLPGSPAVALVTLRAEVSARTRPGPTASRIALEAASEAALRDPVAALPLLDLASRCLVAAEPDHHAWSALSQAWVALPQVHDTISGPWRTLFAARRASAGSGDPTSAWDAALTAVEDGIPLTARVGAITDAATDAASRGAAVRARALVERGTALLRGTQAVLLEDDLARVAVSFRDELDSTLTARELQVLQLVATGAGNQRVATVLGMSPRTVEVHLTRVYRKLGVPSRSGAVAAALKHGLLRPDDLDGAKGHPGTGPVTRTGRG